jgi:hypothetical protein
MLKPSTRVDQAKNSVPPSAAVAGRFDWPVRRRKLLFFDVEPRKTGGNQRRDAQVSLPPWPAKTINAVPAVCFASQKISGITNAAAALNASESCPASHDSKRFVHCGMATFAFCWSARCSPTRATSCKTSHRAGWFGI